MSAIALAGGRRSRRFHVLLCVFAAALFALLGFAASRASAAPLTAIPSNYLDVVDQGGPNDVNASQVDLTRFGRDDSDPDTYKLLWSWDATDDWTGTGQTGDACALFDSNGNGKVDFAVCVQITNPNADPNVVAQNPPSPYLFSCGDDKIDRCTQPVTPISYNSLNLQAGALQSDGTILPSPPADLKTQTDPFPNLNPDQNYPFDSTIAVNISKTLLPAGSVLLNVCTYPSAGDGGNNNPFDCIVNPGDGLLKIVKVAPNGTTQVFSFTVNPGSKNFQITGSGETQPIGLPSVNPVSVSEAVPANWTLDSAVCKLEDGTTVTGTLSGSTVSGITIQPGELTTCTFTNSPQPPQLSVVKDNDGNHDGVYHDTELVPANATYPYTVTYKATISNPGATDSTVTTITDDKVSGDLRTAQAGLTDCADLLGTTLAAGATATCYFDHTFNSPPGPAVTNTLSVTTTNSAGSNTKTDTSTVNFPGKIDVTKTADTGPFSAGDTIGFTITVTNTGAGPANGVTITDTLPTTAGTTWSIDANNSSAGCSIANGALSCNFGTLAPGATRSVHITSSTTSASCGPISNTANGGSTDSGSDSDTASLTVNCGNITISKVADNGTVNAGDTIGFTITVTNTGAGEARGVTVTDALPTTAGTSWTIDGPNSTSGCSIAGGTLTCNFGTLASGASAHVHITSPTTSASCSTISNTAGVTTTNDGSGQSTATVTVNCGAIGLTKTADATTVSAGDTIGFVITATNSGPGTTTTTTVTDTLPTAPGIAWTVDGAHSDSGCTIANGNALTCNFGTLASGQSKHVHITSPTTSGSCTTLNNTAFVTTGNDGSAQASASITVNCGQIGLTKVADDGIVSAGDPIGFVVTATNAGPGTTTNTTVTDTLPTVPGVTWSIDQANSTAGCSLSANVVTCNFGTLAAGASAHVHITGTTDKTSCQTITNTANVTTGNDGSAQASDSVVVNCGDITLTKVADQGTVSAGDTIGYVITAKNVGAGDARDVTVTDNLPTGGGLSWTIDAAGSDAGCSISGGTLTCNFGTLASGASAHVHITSPTGTATCGTVSNTASVTTSNDGSANASASITVDCPDVAVLKVADATSVHAGDAIGFKVTASNTGTGAAHDVVVTDTLPTTAGTSWSIDAANSDTGCSIAGGTLTCNFGTLAAGGSKKVHITSPTTSASCGVVDNTATVSASNDDDDSSSASVNVLCPGVNVVKAGPAVAYHGDTVHFTFTVTNSGNTPLSAVKVTDDHCAVGATPEKRLNDDGDNQLENPGVDGKTSEVWVFGCDYKIPDHQAGEENPIHNTATASGQDSLGRTVTDTDSHNTQVLHPSVHIAKSGPATATQGDAVPYLLTVTNPGDVPLVGQTLEVTDPQCDSMPALIGKNDDATPDTLDPGDTWLYTCSVSTNTAITAIDNVANVKGTDVNGHVVTDTAVAHTDLQAVLPQVIESGAAKLRGPASCVKRDFRFRVTGKHIAKIVFRVDGKVRKTIRFKSGEGTKATYKINPKKFGKGLHKVTARITFNKQNQTASRTLRAVFEKCKKLVIAPKFTG